MERAWPQRIRALCEDEEIDLEVALLLRARTDSWSYALVPSPSSSSAVYIAWSVGIEQITASLYIKRQAGLETRHGLLCESA